VIYQVVGTPSWTRPSAAAATDAAVRSGGADSEEDDYVDPVPMNIGLIVGVAVAIAVLLCMLAYVVYKCVVAGQRPTVAALAPEKTALAVGGDLGPPRQQHHHHHGHAPPHFAVNGRPPPLLTNDSLAPPGGDKKDVKEWYV